MMTSQVNQRDGLPAGDNLQKKMKMRSAFWISADWLARRMVVVDRKGLSKQSALFWALACLLFYGISGYALVYLVFHPRAISDMYLFLAANKDVPAVMIAILFLVCAAAYLVQRIKEWNPFFYGWTQTVFAVISTWGVLRNLNLLEPLPGLLAFGAGAYFVQEGLSNIHEAKSTSRGSA